MTRETYAGLIYQAIRNSQPSVCCFTEAPEVIDGRWYGLKDVGFDGNFDLLKLADVLLAIAVKP